MPNHQTKIIEKLRKISKKKKKILKQRSLQNANELGEYLLIIRILENRSLLKR